MDFSLNDTSQNPTSQTGTGYYSPYPYSTGSQSNALPTGQSNPSAMQVLQQAIQALSSGSGNQLNNLQNVYNAMAANQGNYSTTAANNINNSLGINNLINTYGDLTPYFQLYMADSNINSLFPGISSTATTNPSSNQGVQQSAQQNTQQFQQTQNQNLSTAANMTTNQQPNAVTQVPSTTPTVAPQNTSGSTLNPYMANTSAITSAAENLPLSPALETSEMSAEENALTTVGQLLNNLIGNQQSYGTNLLNNQNTNYSNALTAVGNMFSQLSNQQVNQQNYSLAEQEASAPGTQAYAQQQISNAYVDAGNKMTLQDMLKKYESLGMTANAIYNIYQTVNQPGVGYGPAKQNAQQLASLGITGAPVTTATAAEKATTAPKTMTYGTGANKRVYAWDTKTQKYDIPVNPSQENGGNIWSDILNFLFQSPNQQPGYSSAGVSSNQGGEWE